MKEMNSHDVIQLLSPSANRVFQIVEYEDEDLRAELSELSAGKLVELKLNPVSVRSNVWQANRPEAETEVVA